MKENARLAPRFWPDVCAAYFPVTVTFRFNVLL